MIPLRAKTAARSALLGMVNDAGRESVEARTEWIAQSAAQVMAMAVEQSKIDPAGVERIVQAMLAHIRAQFSPVSLLPDDLGGDAA